MSHTVDPAQMIFETFPVGPLQCNCCVIGDPVSKRAIVIGASSGIGLES